jgi:hypothetical protein
MNVILHGKLGRIQLAMISLLVKPATSNQLALPIMVYLPA